jgi:fatty-acyl-CoA synthase
LTTPPDSTDLLATDPVHHHSRRRPDHPAIEDLVTGEVTSWRALEGRVAGLAGALADDLGVVAGDRVAAIGNNHPWLLTLQFACMRLGAIFVPLNYRLAVPELAFMCTDAEATLLVHDLAWAATAHEIATTAGLGKLASWGVPDGPYDVASGAASASPRGWKRGARLGDTVQLLYTSGTTGRPKGSRCTYRTLQGQTMNSVEPYDLTPDGRYLAVLPFFHAAGLNSMTNPVLALGGTVVVAPGFDPATVVSVLADPGRGITHFSSAPVMCQVMATMPGFDAARFDHLRHLQVGGGFLNHEVTVAFHERGIGPSPGYGSTEMGPIVSVVRPHDSLRKFGSCGAPVQYTNVRVVGEDGVDVPVGETGEVWAQGPAVTPGYWRREIRPDDPDSAFHLDADGLWFRTGDAVTQDDEGFLTIVDRFKDMYKSGGENVYPAEVERTLHEHPDVADAAVIPVRDPRWGEVGRALIVPRPGAELDVSSIAEHCRERLAKYKVPAQFVPVEPFERNVTGKIPKADLKARYGDPESTVAPT